MKDGTGPEAAVDARGDYRRPNLKDERRSYKFTFSGFLAVPGRTKGSPASEAWDVLLFFLSWLEDL